MFYLVTNLELNPAITLDAAIQQPLPSGGPTRRTRTATRSPQKRAVFAPSKAPTGRPLKKKKKNRVLLPSAPVMSPPASPPPAGPTVPAATASQLPPSPYHVPFRIKKTLRVPHGLVGFSQARDDEELISDEDPGDDVARLPTSFPYHDGEEECRPADPFPDSSPALNIAVDNGYELSSDSEDNPHRMYICVTS
jgi:hypothetical protein